MNAFQFCKKSNELSLNHVPIPKPGPDQVLLRVEAVGLCHTDCSFLLGHNLPFLEKDVITLGHEVAGVVHSVGGGVDGWAVGDRAAIAHIAHPMAQRDFTVSPGLGIDGGFAPFIVIPASRLLRVPESIPLSYAAIATDAIASSYHAVAIEGNVQAGMTVAIIGLGGLGMPGLRTAVLRGAEVDGFDLVEAKFEEAIALGARKCWTGILDADVQYDVVVDFVGSNKTVNDSISRVKDGGRVVLVGFSPGNVEITPSVLITRSIVLVGSAGASVADLEEVFRLLAKGELFPTATEIQFEDIPEALKQLSQGGVHGRQWTKPPEV